jgi:hypothetical protein
MTMTPTERQMAHCRRKRARGECIYGGCHLKASKGGLCLGCYARQYERKLVWKLTKLSATDLLDLRERYKDSIRRVDAEIARRMNGA